jgi:hypothetical protein
MRIIFPQQFMTEVDTLHGGFLTIDEKGPAAVCHPPRPTARRKKLH